MHQRKQYQSDRPFSTEQSRQQQRQAVMQEDQQFAGWERGEELSRALDMQAQQYKELQRRQGQ